MTGSTTPKGSIIGSQAYGNPIAQTGLAVGDVNGDGINDIIIGQYLYGATGNGRIYIVAGQATWPYGPANLIDVSLLTGIPNATPACSASSQVCGTVITGDDGYGPPGGGLSVGSGVFGDTAPYIMSQNTGVTAAYTDNYLIKGGGAAFTSASYDMTTLITNGTAWDFNSNSNSNVALGLSNYNAAGTAGMIGNINSKSGSPGLIFGAPGNGAVPTAFGSVYVLFGGNGLMTGGDVYASPPNGTTGVRIDCPYADNNTCGESFDEVDMNGDGIPDLVIGVGNGSVTGSNNEGYVYVIYGKSSGWSSTYSLSNIY